MSFFLQDFYYIIVLQLDATVKYDLFTRLESMPKHNKLCHGDFNTSNVIISKDGTPYILDWAHATQGNASADVARTYLLFCLGGEEVDTGIGAKPHNFHFVRQSFGYFTGIAPHAPRGA
mgnify:CR=1 FL=1